VIEAAEHGEASSGSDPEVEKLRSELMRIAEERDTTTRERDIAQEDLRKKSEILAEMSVRLEALTSKPGIKSNAKQTPDVRGADPRLVTHINNLQEQLYAERNSNRRLRGG
jgi:chromatin segregation and condensation protein Rec8/ScpA/Scc1 (kleisin family)